MFVKLLNFDKIFFLFAKKLSLIYLILFTQYILYIFSTVQHCDPVTLTKNWKKRTQT